MVVGTVQMVSAIGYPLAASLQAGLAENPRELALSARCSEVCKFTAQRDAAPSYPGVCER
jgi:hypothetical protein